MSGSKARSAKVAAIAATHAGRTPDDDRRAVARLRADRIRQGLDAFASLREDIAEAYAAQDWKPLGYGSWDEYVTEEFAAPRLRLPRNERQQVVAFFREKGMSTRAIAAATGTSKDTVHRDLAGVSSETAGFSNVVGIDGKAYPARQPEPDVVDAEIVEDAPENLPPITTEKIAELREAEVRPLPQPEPAPALKDRVEKVKARGWTRAAHGYTPERAIVTTIDDIAGHFTTVTPAILPEDYEYVDSDEVPRLVEQIDKARAALAQMKKALLDRGGDSRG